MRKINDIKVTIQNLIDYKGYENHSGAQHVSNFGGRDITWNLVVIKDNRYQTTLARYKDAIGVVYSAAGDKKSKFIGLPVGKTVDMVKAFV